MSSGDSDDEPLSVFANAKKETLNFEIEIIPVTTKKKKKKKPFESKQPCNVTIELQSSKESQETVIERPIDVWMYLKDLNPIGPYSCLLCSEWFINKTKIALHYIVNHKKSYCGICRYFVSNDEAWEAHSQFHTPWSCSQCDNTFDTMKELRKHFSEQHTLVHCRLCHTRVPDNDEYKTHLFQKHNVTNVSHKDDEVFWIFENDYEKFKCVLCAKQNNGIRTYSNHYMAFHRMTLKCLAWILSGKDFQFKIKGAELTQHYLESELKAYGKYGYIDLDMRPNCAREINFDDSAENQQKEINKVKEEVSFEDDVSDNPGDDKSEISEEVDEEMKNYKGVEDFDVTLMELIVIQKCYSQYLSQTMRDINSNLMPINSNINYDNATSDVLKDMDCSLCPEKFNTLNTFLSHMMKMHCVKMVSTFSCRVCATVFDSLSELETHISQELGEFEDLWICQFCDKEFDDRQKTRSHLTEHWNEIETDNCFSPHLGFKCKYCPILFWNEIEREKHQVNTHFDSYSEDYYKCAGCDELFSDKVWLIHHFIQNHQNNKDPEAVYLVKCSICCLVLQTVEDMRIHFDMNHPEARKVFCSLGTCKHKPFSHRKSFQLHLTMYHIRPRARGGEWHGTCAVCGVQFASKRAANAHAAQAHRLSCAVCQRTLTTLDERKIHYLMCHPGQHPFQCDLCDKSFQYKSSLYLHKHDHAPNKQDYTCSYCGKVFKKRDSFREHEAIHSGPRHACSYCPMVFVQRSNMLRHERRHTGERPYACALCPRTFADKGACTSHARTHQKNSSFSCMYCGQTFVQKSKLTYHIRKHTGENLETCSVCSKIFTSPCSLREHMKIHEKTSENTAKCPLCGKWYKDEKSMMKHVRTTHTGIRFTCPICNKKVTSAASLREHVLSHSKMNTFRCKICPKGYSVRRTIIRHLRRRHGFKINDDNITQYFYRLDPKECNLNLDEATMKSIFGIRKRKMPDILIRDYVTVKNMKMNEVTDDKSQSESDKDSDKESETEVLINQNVVIKEEPMERDDNEQNLEPTDFVSVKIECIDPIDSDAKI